MIHTRTRWQRIATSPFADDIRRGLDRALMVLGAFGVVFTFLILLRGAEYAALLTGLAQ